MNGSKEEKFWNMWHTSIWPRLWGPGGGKVLNFDFSDPKYVRDVFQHGENASLNEKHIQIMLLQKALKGPNTHKDPRTI